MIQRHKNCPRATCLQRNECLHDPCEADFGAGWVTVEGINIAYEYDKDFGFVRSWSPDALDVRGNGLTKTDAVKNFMENYKKRWHMTRLNRIRREFNQLCQRLPDYHLVDYSKPHNIRNEIVDLLAEFERLLANELRRTNETNDTVVLYMPAKKSKGLAWLWRKAGILLQKAYR